jgi:hypothetical protein
MSFVRTTICALPVDGKWSRPAIPERSGKRGCSTGVLLPTTTGPSGTVMVSDLRPSPRWFEHTGGLQRQGHEHDHAGSAGQRDAEPASSGQLGLLHHGRLRRSHGSRRSPFEDCSGPNSGDYLSTLQGPPPRSKVVQHHVRQRVPDGGAWRGRVAMPAGRFEEPRIGWRSPTD